MENIQNKIKQVLHKIFGSNMTDGLLYKLMVYLILISISYVFLYPLLKMLSMSFMGKEDIINPEVLWIPTEFTLSNLRVASFVMNLETSFFQTLWFVTLLALSQTVVTALTGFALARFNFKFKKVWFVFILMSFVIPIPIVIIPRIMMFVGFQESTGAQMIGTIYPQFFMTITGQGINSAIAILIFYNFFRMIPFSLDEAAMIDGASTLQVFYHVILKMSFTAITIVFLFSFVWTWNETYVAGTFVRSGIELMSIKLGAFDSVFQTMGTAIPGQSGEARINEAYKMAATFISMLPLLVLYFIAQKQFIEGIENTGITGE